MNKRVGTPVPIVGRPIVFLSCWQVSINTITHICCFPTGHGWAIPTPRVENVLMQAYTVRGLKYAGAQISLMGSDCEKPYFYVLHRGQSAQ